MKMRRRACAAKERETPAVSFVSLENVHKRYVVGEVTIHAANGMSFAIFLP